MNTLLVNPLASPSQLSTSTSSLDGIPNDLQTSAIFLGCRLSQSAGILLQLPQQIIAQAIVIFTRFWVGPDGGSLRDHSIKDVSAAAIFLAAKPTSWIRAPRTIINTYAYLLSLGTLFPEPSHLNKDIPESYYVSEGTYLALRTTLLSVESEILRVIGYDTFVALPHTLCISYLQALEVFQLESAEISAALAKRAFALLNSSLQNPQLLYLTHQPYELACAAIYLAAREVGVKLPGEQWWEVFDTDRERLGFLVVAMRSMEGFVRSEKEKWNGRRMPITIKGLEIAIEEEKNGG